MNNKGFMTLTSIFVTAIVLIVAVSIITLTHMNFLTTNAFIKGKKVFYQAEGKLYLCMYKDKYFYNEVIPRMEHYMKYGNLKAYEGGNVIELDEEDLSPGDLIKKINVELFYEDEEIKTRLTIPSKNYGLPQKIVGIFNMIEWLYRMNLPILAMETLSAEKHMYFENFCNELKENIIIDDSVENITLIEGNDYEKVSLEEDIELKNYIAYMFKEGKPEPYKEISIVNNNIFLILKQKKNIKPQLKIKNSVSQQPIQGIIYVEGDIILYDNVVICGIIVVENGSIIVEGEGRPTIDGLVILSKYDDDLELLNELVDVNYNKEYIHRYGPLLPNYFEPELEVLKIYEGY